MTHTSHARRFPATVLRTSLIIFLLALAACKKEKDIEPAAPFAGRYEVQKSSNTTYLMTVEQQSGQWLIRNFGGFMNVPVKAQVSGQTMTIPSQTFQNGNGKSLTLAGTATLTTTNQPNDVLNVDYQVSGFTQYESSIVAKRKAK